MTRTDRPPGAAFRVGCPRRRGSGRARRRQPAQQARGEPGGESDACYRHRGARGEQREGVRIPEGGDRVERGAPADGEAGDAERGEPEAHRPLPGPDREG